MWRYLFSFAIVLGLGIFLLAGRNHNDTKPGPEVHSTEYELTSKQAILDQDVKLTDELCRTQCTVDLTRMAMQISSGQDAKQVLSQMKTHHEKMDVLIWSDASQSLEQGTKVGEIPPQYRDQALAYMKEAKAAAEAGKSYQSPHIGQGDQEYFVVGVPAQGGKKSLVGLIHQGILQQVANHQKKNLRLEPYPNENRWKVESVDTDTLKEKNVVHPEDNQGTSHYHENEVVVKFNKEPSAAQIDQIKSEIGATSVRKIGYTYVFLAEKMQAKQLMAYFSKWNVQYVEPHFLYLTNDTMGETAPNTPEPTDNADKVTANFLPNDNLFSKYQWNLPLIETVEGWQVTKGAEDIIVGVVDTGADLHHPDLQGQLAQGYNVVGQNDVPDDDVGHGTHVAGVISALVNNNLGVAGMTWFNKVMPVKVLDQTGAGSTYSVAQGIIWATDHGAKVINMSLGNYADSNFLHDAVKYAFDKDVVLVAASGNDNTDRPGFPAAYPEVLAVAATDSNKKKASFSNYGDYIGVAAPGVNIASTYPGSQYAALSGTSMASPHVTALAALVRSANPQLKNTEVYEIIRKSAQDLGDPGKDKYYGYGLIDVVKAVKAANPPKNPVSYWPHFTARQLAQVKTK
jgi:thermitase